METEEPDKQGREVIFIDKVGLLQASTEKIDAWIASVEEKKPGTKITKRALVNWMIQHMGPLPSKSEVSMLVEEFYDEERHLKQRIKELQSRKARSSEPSVSSLSVQDKDPGEQSISVLPDDGE